MSERPPSLTKQDVEHLRLLSIFHYIFAAMAILGLIFIGVHYLILNSFLFNHKGQGLPPEFMTILRLGYVVVAGITLIGGILNFVSASNLR